MNDKLAINTELKSIAETMRSRQESINRDKNNLYGRIASLIATAQEQGQDILTVKTKLGKASSFSDWLSAHVPTLSEKDAAKYERLTHEQLSDPRQCMFAFLPAPDKTQEETVGRTPPSEFEVTWGKTFNFVKAFRSVAVDDWTELQRENVRRELTPIMIKVWPDGFKASQ